MAIHDRSYEAAATMMGVMNASGMQLPDDFEVLEGSMKKLKIRYHMRRAYEEHGRKLGPGETPHTRTFNTFSELEEAREAAKILGLHVPRGYKSLKKAVDSEMAKEFLADASNWVNGWNETGRLYIDPSLIERIVETSEMCYRRAGEAVPDEINAVRMEVATMREKGVRASPSPFSV
jgi:hypothetical protein